MIVTIEQIKDDIHSGECNAIYLSTQTLWWSHLFSDVMSATVLGHAIIHLNLKAILEDPKTSKKEMRKCRRGLKNNKQFNFHQASDPVGSPLIPIYNMHVFIDEVLKDPSDFGKHGINAFLKTHHRNCLGKTFRTWKEVNKELDEGG